LEETHGAVPAAVKCCDRYPWCSAKPRGSWFLWLACRAGCRAAGEELGSLGECTVMVADP